MRPASAPRTGAAWVSGAARSNGIGVAHAFGAVTAPEPHRDELEADMAPWVLSLRTVGSGIE